MKKKNDQSGLKIRSKQHLKPMFRPVRGLIAAVIIACALLLSAEPCRAETKRSDAVATVNSRPIYSSQLKAAYDLLHLSWGGVLSSSLTRLKSDYGEVMAELIVTELINEELEKRNLQVTDKDMERVEREIRADYPNTSFEDSLVEEYIDLKTWRAQLKSTLSREKFTREVLRPRIRLDHQEIEKYYNAHIDEFHIPATVRFMLFSGGGKDMVREAMAAYLDGRDKAAIEELFPQVSMQETRSSAEELAAVKGKETARLELKKAGPILKQNNVYEAVILLERLPETVLPAAKVYPIIETALLEEKIETLFQTWLEERLKHSKIYVSSELSELGNIQEQDEEEESEDNATR